MRKVIGALVVVLFLLSVAALYLGNELFSKREILKGRTQALEIAIAKLGKVIEAQPPVAPELKPDDFPAKDISTCKAETLDKPELSAFWQKYKRELEVADIPTINMDTDANRAALMNLFKRNPVDQSIVRNAMGYPETKGDGTMYSVLDEMLIKKASEQLDRLNDARQQLKDLRVELADTIREINKLKPELRGKLKEIVELNEKIEAKDKEVKAANEATEAVKAEKKELEDKVNQAKADMARKEEELSNKDAEIKQLKKKIEELNQNPPDKPDNGPGAEPPTWKPSVGQKGRVMQVQASWNFVIVELTDQFIAESQAANRATMAGVELCVKRPGAPDKFVGKIKIKQLKQGGKLAIADILLPWQQLPMKDGDVLFF